MVKLICGHNGSGKTNKMIERANAEVSNIQGKMVFIEANNKHLYDLNHKVRYINTKEYGIKDEEQFYGFVCGMLAADYDIEEVYIDGLYKITEGCNIEKAELIIEKLEFLSKEFDVRFLLSLNFEYDDMPQSFKDKVIQ